MYQYKVIDNFLEKKHYEELCNLKLKKISPKGISVYHNKFFNNGKIIGTCLKDSIIDEMQKYYHKKAIEILNDHAPKKIALYKYSEFHIVEIGSHYSFPIHRDTPNKLLSGVVYLKPEKNNGTFLYSDRHGNNKKEIEWKQNRGLFFSRTESQSWHSYEGDKKNNRLVLIYNLMTANIKGVCEVEGINYNKVILREKLNPYLFKFFKFMI